MYKVNGVDQGLRGSDSSEIDCYIKLLINILVLE